MSRATRLTIAVTVFCAIALALFAFMVLAQRSEDLARQTALQLRIEAIAVEPQARALLRGETTELHVAAEIAVYDQNALRVLPPDPLAVPNPRVRRVLETSTPHDVRVDQTVVYRAPVLDDRGEAIGAMELAREVESDEVGGMIWALALALLALFALAAWIYARLEVRRPLAELLHGIDSVARGDLAATLPLGRRDEIGQLAFRFNEMTARLREAQQELKTAFDAKLELEEQVRQSEKLATVGQLAAEIAHEVGTPLGVIAGRAKNLAKKAGSPDEVQRHADLIGEQASRIARIIQQLLDYTRRRPPTRGPVHLNALARGTLAMLDHQIERRGVHVELHEEELPPIYGNAGQIQQVCLNLALNAIQAMPSGGDLQLHTGRVHRRKAGLEADAARDYAVIEVVDSGVGIPEQHRGHVFEPFFTTKSDDDRGTGLGLAVSRGIVEEHDGWIEFEPRSEGGTVFRVFLPLEMVHG
jgi:signal transduction histidine kinase